MELLPLLLLQLLPPPSLSRPTDLLLQLALKLPELPAVPLLCLLQRWLVRLWGLPQGWQLCLPLAHRAHQTLLLSLEGLHGAAHLLRCLARCERERELGRERDTEWKWREEVRGRKRKAWGHARLPSRCSAGWPWSESPRPSSPLAPFAAGPVQTSAPPPAEDNPVLHLHSSPKPLCSELPSLLLSPLWFLPSSSEFMHIILFCFSFRSAPIVNC